MNRVKVTETVVGAIQVGQKPRHVCLTEGVFLVARVSAAVQQKRVFVPDVILPGHRRAPQWVLARTPTAHWGLDSRRRGVRLDVAE